jgi:hypothetical protein
MPTQSKTVPRSHECLVGTLSGSLAVAWRVIAFRIDDPHRSERLLGNLLLFLRLLDVKSGCSSPFDDHSPELDRSLCMVSVHEE